MAKSKRDLGRAYLGPLIAKNPRLLSVLDKHGVHFCSGCYLTFFSPLKKVAAYHAVPNAGKFLEDMRKAVRSGGAAVANAAGLKR